MVKIVIYTGEYNNSLYFSPFTIYALKIVYTPRDGLCGEVSNKIIPLYEMYIYLNKTRVKGHMNSNSIMIHY